MAVGKRVTVGAAATKVGSLGQLVTLHNRDATNSVDLGGSGVTAGAGYELKPGDVLTVDLRGSGDLYAIADVGTPRVDVLAVRAAGF